MTDEGGEAISATPEVTDPHVTHLNPRLILKELIATCLQVRERA